MSVKIDTRDRPVGMDDLSEVLREVVAPQSIRVYAENSAGEREYAEGVVAENIVEQAAQGGSNVTERVVTLYPQGGETSVSPPDNQGPVESWHLRTPTGAPTAVRLRGFYRAKDIYDPTERLDVTGLELVRRADRDHCPQCRGTTLFKRFAAWECADCGRRFDDANG